MLEAICLLAVGVFVGRVWAWLKTVADDSNRDEYTIQGRAWDARDEINELRQQGEDAMRRAANDWDWR